MQGEGYPKPSKYVKGKENRQSSNANPGTRNMHSNPVTKREKKENQRNRAAPSTPMTAPNVSGRGTRVANAPAPVELGAPAEAAVVAGATGVVTLGRPEECGPAEAEEVAFRPLDAVPLDEIPVEEAREEVRDAEADAEWLPWAVDEAAALELEAATSS
jgi:hypothetical protein